MLTQNYDFRAVTKVRIDYWR